MVIESYKTSKKFIFFAAVLGNILEYYDFTVYSIFSIVIGQTFFNSEDPFIQTLSSLAVFASGFLTRPIGGIVFGYIGDRYGRKRSLICSMIGMTLPTLIIGFLPGYDTIGFFAPILLLISRLVQGFSLSGEGVGTAIFILEHYHKSHPGFITALAHSTNTIGPLLASSVGIIISKYFSHEPNAWRIAFLLGGLFGIVGFILRLKISETPIFINMSIQKSKKAPFIDVVQNSLPLMILTLTVGAVTSSIVYLVKSYINIFYVDVMKLDDLVSLQYSSYSFIILTTAMPIFGILVDIWGKKRMMIIVVISLIFLTTPALLLMASHNLCYRVLGLTLLPLLAGAVAGCSYIFIISLFSPEQRFTGVTFSFNLGIAIFGGTSAMVSRLLVEKTGLYYAPGFYILLTSSLFLIALVFNSERISRLPI